jgi:orotidine-5'-phosphate decarboxylase
MPDQPRDRLVLALDVGDLAAAEALATRFAPWFGIAKVGLELYAETGPAAIDRFHALGLRVFADLKLYDIPTTVERAARALGRRGVDFLNFATMPGGEPMLRAGVSGLAEGSRSGGHGSPPVSLAVTVLTSDNVIDAFDERLETAAAAGCDGIVCSGHEVTRAKSRYPGLRTMVPGIRLPGGEHHDQARVATPGDVIAAGGDWLVIGRAVTTAADPDAAAAELTRAVADALPSVARK